MAHDLHDDGRLDETRPLHELVTGTPPVAMVMTMVGDTHTSRPVTVAQVEHSRLSFLASHQADWVQAVASGSAIVHVTLASDAHTTYLSLNGTATVSDDPALKQRLWSAPAKAWFAGPDDPDLAVVHFDLTDGRYWDGPDGLIGRGLAMLRAAMGSDGGTGRSGAIGTSG